MKHTRLSRADFSAVDKALWKVKAWKQGKPCKVVNRDAKGNINGKIDARVAWGDPNRPRQALHYTD